MTCLIHSSQMAVPGESAKSPRPPSVSQNHRPPSVTAYDLNESSMSLPPLPSEGGHMTSNTSTTFQTSQEHFRSNSSLATVRDRPITPIYPPPFPKFESPNQPCYTPDLFRPSSVTPIPVNGVYGQGNSSYMAEQSTTMMHHQSRSFQTSTVETTQQSENGFIDVVPSKSWTDL